MPLPPPFSEDEGIDDPEDRKGPLGTLVTVSVAVDTGLSAPLDLRFSNTGEPFPSFFLRLLRAASFSFFSFSFVFFSFFLSMEDMLAYLDKLPKRQEKKGFHFSTRHQLRLNATKYSTHLPANR